MTTSPAETAASAKTTRRPGRPVAGEHTPINRDIIVATALELTKILPLQEVSIVQVSKALGVTPALIHYHMGGRKALTSSAMNAFYKYASSSWPMPSGNWRAHLSVMAHAILDAFMRYPGVVLYSMSHNRYRLVQTVDEGEIDYGFVFFDKTVQSMMLANFDATHTAIFCHLLIEFITVQAYGAVNNRRPGAHAEFLRTRLGTIDPKIYMGADFVRESFLEMTSSVLFEHGLNLLLNSFNYERTQLAASSMTGLR